MKNLSFITLLFLSLNLFAQQQTSLSMGECEALFQKNNLDLIAASFNVSAAKAAVIQAKTWENPTLSVGLDAYNPEKKKYFDIGANGEKSAGIEQLIYLGGKKRNEVAIASKNAEIAEIEFTDLLRNLKLQLRQSYFGLYYQNLSYQSISKQLSNLDSLVISYKTQVAKGNVALKDVVRLQSLEFSLKNQKTQLFENILDYQGKLTLLTGLTGTINPAPSEKELMLYKGNKDLQPDNLLQMALSSRPDLQIVQKQTDASSLNVKLQKSKSIPDLTLGGNWEQLGGAFKNEVSLNLGIPIPLWNTNRGNIRMAKAQLNEISVQQNILKNKITNEVSQSFQKYREAVDNYKFLSKSSLENLESVQNGIFKNFRNGNLSLIEFTDFMESYHSTLMQYYQFEQDLVNRCEEINYITNSKIF